MQQLVITPMWNETIATDFCYKCKFTLLVESGHIWMCANQTIVQSLQNRINNN